MTTTISIAAALRSVLSRLMPAGSISEQRPTRLGRGDLSPALLRDLGLDDGRPTQARDPLRD